MPIGRHLVACAFLLSPVAALAQSGGYLHLAGFTTKLTGTLTDDFGGDAPLSFDLQDDLGFDYDYGGEGRAGGRFGIHRLSVGAAMFRHEADRTVSGFDFRGTSFNASATFKNRLGWIEAEYGIAPFKTGLAKLELVVGARFYQYEGEASGTAEVGDRIESASERLEETAPVPHLGATLELNPIPLLVLRGAVKGVSIKIGDDEGSTLDFEATAGVHLGALELGGGVRAMDIDIALDGGATAFDFKYRGLIAYLRFSG